MLWMILVRFIYIWYHALQLVPTHFIVVSMCTMIRHSQGVQQVFSWSVVQCIRVFKDKIWLHICNILHWKMSWAWWYLLDMMPTGWYHILCPPCMHSSSSKNQVLCSLPTHHPENLWTNYFTNNHDEQWSSELFVWCYGKQNYYSAQTSEYFLYIIHLLCNRISGKLPDCSLPGNLS